MKEIFFLCLCDREGMEIAVTNVITLTMYKIGVGNEEGVQDWCYCSYWGRKSMRICMNFDMMVYAVYVLIFHSKNLSYCCLYIWRM